MPPSLLKDNQIIGLNNKQDILKVIRKELDEDDGEFGTALSDEKVIQRMASRRYGLGKLDVTGGRGLRPFANWGVPSEDVSAPNRENQDKIFGKMREGFRS
jgi:hypothetical protein